MNHLVGNPAVHVIICGIQRDEVDVCLRRFDVSWYLEPLAASTDSLQALLDGNPPVIRGGPHNLFAIVDRAGPADAVAAWLAAMATCPRSEVTPVLVSTQSDDEPDYRPTDAVLAAHPVLNASSTSLPAGRITIHHWSATEARIGGFVAALLVSLPTDIAAQLARPDTLPVSGLIEHYPPRQESGPLPSPVPARSPSSTPVSTIAAPPPTAEPTVEHGQQEAPVIEFSGPPAPNPAPVAPQPDDCHVLLVTSTKGGVGKSSVALGIAAYVAGQWRSAATNPSTRRRVCIVDFDLDSPSLAVMTSTSTPTMAPLCLEPTIDPATVSRYVIPAPHLQLDVLNAPALPQEARLLTVAMVESILRALTHLYDIVVVDADKLDWDAEGVQRPLIDQASQVVIVADPVLTSVRGLALVRDILCGPDGYNLSASHVGVVWNRVHNQLGLPFRDIEQRTGLTHLQYLPDTSGDHARAINATKFHLILRDRPDWAARIHLLGESLFGPGTVTPISRAVAQLLPTLHRNGQTRGELRVRRGLLGRIRLRPVFARHPTPREDL